MHSFASIRPRLAEWRGWLPAAALPAFMFIALIALGGDRGYFYRDGGIHGWNTAKNMAIAENLSPERNFLLAFHIWRDEDGDFRHYLYGRFPIGGYALLKLAMLPFGADLAAKLLAARVLMLLMFCGAAALAFLAVSRAIGSRPVALAAVLLAFSGFYAVYFADGVSGEAVMDVFGAAAAVVFAASVFYAGQRDHDAAEAERRKAVMSDFSAIRETTRGESVAIFPRRDHKLERLLKYYYTAKYYLAGSYWVESEDGCAARVADFAVSRYRDESLNLLTPDNRFAFLYESASPLELCRAERRRLDASEPAARGAFDVYLQDGALSHLKAPCEPRDRDAFFAYVYPADPNDLPAERRRNGFYPMWRGGEEIAAFDGGCLITLHLPDYPISAIRTGQAAPDGETAWDVTITPPPSAEARAYYEDAYQATASSGEPAARSGGFDLYLDGDRDTLSYLKAPCGESDTRGRFFLSVHPPAAADLPAERREVGHESLNFEFAPPAGVVFGGKCMATRRLPDYEIAKIETGQWVPGGGELWDAAVAVGE